MLSRFSHVQLFVTLWTVVCQAPLSMGFSRQEYWSGLPFLSPGDLPDPGIEPRSPALEAGAWIAMVSSNSIGSVLTESGYAQLLSHVWLSAPSRTVIRQAPLSMGFSRQEYWSR